MKHYDIDLDEQDFADEMIRQIEKDYGRSVARIPYFRYADEPHAFDIKIIFTDFRLLEAKINVKFIYGLPTVTIQGTYL